MSPRFSLFFRELTDCENDACHKYMSPIKNVTSDVAERCYRPCTTFELQRNPLRIALWHKSQGHGSATCSPETRIRTLMPPLAATSISTEAMSPACLGEPSGSHAFPPAIVLTATLALSTAFPFRPVIGTASNYRTYAAR